MLTGDRSVVKRVTAAQSGIGFKHVRLARCERHGGCSAREGDKGHEVARRICGRPRFDVVDDCGNTLERLFRHSKWMRDARASDRRR